MTNSQIFLLIDIYNVNMYLQRSKELPQGNPEADLEYLVDNAYVELFDYKDPNVQNKFITEDGKMVVREYLSTHVRTIEL